MTDTDSGTRLRERLNAGALRIRGKDGIDYKVRPIRPSDRDSLMRGYDTLTQRGKWFRMLHSVPHLSEAMAAKFCAPDGASEVCAVIEGQGALEGEIIGGARVIDIGPGKAAEFSVSLRPEARGQGLARQVLEIVLGIAREAGCRSVWGIIAGANTDMLNLAKRVGFTVRHDPDDVSLRRAEMVF